MIERQKKAREKIYFLYIFLLNKIMIIVIFFFKLIVYKYNVQLNILLFELLSTNKKLYILSRLYRIK